MIRGNFRGMSSSTLGDPQKSKELEAKYLKFLNVRNVFLFNNLLNKEQVLLISGDAGN